jgi:general secretion pathway protein G
MGCNLRRLFLVFSLCATASAGVACYQSKRTQKEQSLRQNLVLLRLEAGQFTLDHHRPPSSLSELVSEGYFKKIPVDPFTGRNDTWRVTKSSRTLEIYSGSDEIGSNGSPYRTW